MTDLSETGRKALWEQFVLEHRKAYETLDSSVRTLAAAGIAVTVSLATALKTISPAGIWPSDFSWQAEGSSKCDG